MQESSDAPDSLTEDQSRVLANAQQPVRLVDAEGNVLAVIKPRWSDEEIAEAEPVLTSNEPGYTYEEVKEHLRNLTRK